MILAAEVFCGVPDSRAQIALQARHDYLTTSLGPGDVISGDFDGDGAIDLVCLEGAAPTPVLSFYQGSGNGSFDPPLLVPSVLLTIRGMVGDVNADGREDIIGIGAYAFNELVVFLGSGSPGLFEPPRRLDLAASSSRLALGDLNEDGNVDAVVPHPGANLVTVCLGDGTGTFSVLSRLTEATAPYSVGIADFDRDGHLDFALASFPLQLYRGHGDGTFDPPMSYAVPDFAPWLVVTDFNQDLWPDLALAGRNGSSAILFRNNQAGGFFRPTLTEAGTVFGNRIAAADLNSDAFPDLIIGAAAADRGTASVLSWILSNGAGGYLPPVVEREVPNPRGIAVDDFNADGNLDVAVSGSQASDFSVLLGDGAGGLGPFARSIPVPHGVSILSPAADWTGDGRPDVIAGEVGNLVTQFWLFVNQADGSFPRQAAGRAGSQIHDLVDGDFNQDGRLDLAVASDQGLLFHGDGQGHFSSGPVLALPGIAEGVGRGDFNEDGLLDLVFSIPSASQAHVFLANGSGGYVLNRVLGIHDRAVDVADVDGDGHLDLGFVWGRDGPTIYFGDGAGNFPSRTFPPYQTGSPRSVALADLNGDGLLDLSVVGDAPDFRLGRVSVSLNTSGRGFSVREFHVLSRWPQIVEAFDADGDGILDLACATQTGSNVRVFRGRGDGTFEAPLYSFGCGNSTYAKRMAIADFDGDRRPDLMVATEVSGDLSLLYNRSPGYPGPIRRCLKGGVNAGRGTLSNVLFVNGSAGDSLNRFLTLAPGSPLSITMIQPPSRAGRSPESHFALFGWRALPRGAALVSLPLETGCLVLPIPVTGRSPQPRRTWNNIGFGAYLGEPDEPSSPAPSTVVNLPNGLARPVTFTLQGLIRDDGSAGRRRVSPTNGIVVRIE